MSDRAAASVAFTAAGVAFAATFLPWPTAQWIAAAGAGAALAVFGFRRYGILARQVSGPIGGLAGVVLALVGLYALSTPATGGRTGGAIGPTIAAIAGGVVLTFGYADWRAIPRQQLGGKVTAAALAAGIGVTGLLAIVVWVSVITSVVRPAVGGALDPSGRTVLSALALGLGTASVAGLYLRASDRGIRFIDFDQPGVRDATYVAGGVIAIVGLNISIGLLFERLGLEAARHSVLRTAESNPEILLVLIPLSYLIIGPGEELLYRNIVQKSLYDAFSRPAAIVVASAIFAGVHLFAFSPADGNPLGTLNTLIVVFLLALVLGTAYERTENILVPAVIHGTFNAIAFAVTYAQLTGAFT